MNFRVKTIAPFPSQVSGSCMSFQKCTCLFKHVIVFAFNKIGNKLITFRQMSICKFRFHYFRVSQTMIELKDCAADAACAVPGESHCLGQCGLVSGKHYWKPHTFGGSEALCCQCYLVQVQLECILQAVLHQIWLSQAYSSRADMTSICSC